MTLVDVRAFERSIARLRPPKDITEFLAAQPDRMEPMAFEVVAREVLRRMEAA